MDRDRSSPCWTAAAALGALLASLSAAAARADEGMWTFDDFPIAAVEKKYGFRPDQAWLDHVRLSAARLAQGCSASFVSADGLVMTNHHCAEQCIEQLSSSARNLLATGFHAEALADEPRCPELEVNQLISISDVTARMRQATSALEGQAFFEAQRAEKARIEKACQTTPALRCEVVALYHGGIYSLYSYRRFQDVRLVFAPEFDIAFFGGDPDNFMFPRYDLDVSFLRVYQDGKPARMNHWFRWSAAGPAEGELTFVPGNPGGTQRQLTVAELEYQRDHVLPDYLLDLAELRGLLTEYQRRGPEERRHSSGRLFGVENSYKALRGRLEALLDRQLMASKIADEKALRAKLAEDPQAAKLYLPAFEAIARAEEDLARFWRPYRYVEQGASFGGDLFRIARTLVRGTEEREKPNDVRFREYQESALPGVTQRLFSPAPTYPEFEILLLEHSLSMMRRELGADHPFVRKVLGKMTPGELAGALVKGTRLESVALRRTLWEGGKAAVDASRDPMIEMARRIDPDGRALRRKYEDRIEPVLQKNDELLARARFELRGAGTYPDGTFTPRLSYGQVKGWREGDRWVKPFTLLRGAFERATGHDPFRLPASWMQARARLDLATPFDFCTTNDIIGGNSGSPVVNRAGEIVGLVFDGNLWSLGGEYGFDEAMNRAVAVDSAAILEALEHVYGARRIVDELLPPRPRAARATRPRP